MRRSYLWKGLGLLLTVALAYLAGAVTVARGDSFLTFRACLTENGRLVDVTLDPAKPLDCKKGTPVSWGQGGAQPLQIEKRSRRVQIPAGAADGYPAWCQEDEIVVSGGFQQPGPQPGLMILGTWPSVEGDSWVTTVYNDSDNDYAMTVWVLCAKK